MFAVCFLTVFLKQSSFAGGYFADMVVVSIVTASYLSFSLVVYRWCGQWVASPSLGSAGPVIKKVAYGIGLIGLLVSACLYLHVAAK